MSVSIKNRAGNLAPSLEADTFPAEIPHDADVRPRLRSQEYRSDQGTMDRLGSEDAGSTELVAFDPNIYFHRIPAETQPRESFDVVQKWHGYVLEVRDKTFLARMTTILGEGPDQEAEIRLKAINPEDLDLLEVGAFFYWSLGYLRRTNNEVRKHSDLRFRRLPLWREGAHELAHVEKQNIRQLLSNE